MDLLLHFALLLCFYTIFINDFDIVEQIKGIWILNRTTDGAFKTLF